MRTLHFDCFSGISGDMTLAALIDVGVDAEAIRRGIDSLGLPVKLTFAKKRRCGLFGIYVEIEAQEQKDRRHLPEIEGYIARSALTARAKEYAVRIFRKLGEAEATVHGIPLEKVHFHEVGALDSIADIVGTAVGFDALGVERFTSRAVPPGSGTVKCAHGLMPVPAPATALLLKGAPLATVPVTGEMTTPTGAAILAAMVNEWVEQPEMTVEHVGHGLGTRDFPDWPNVLRIIIGQTATTRLGADYSDAVWVLETNLDDVPGEVIGYCFDQLFAAGALDVYSVPIQMKKNRPGVLLSVIAPVDKVQRLEAILFHETGTFGVRRTRAERSKLMRAIVEVQTPWGLVKCKKGWREGLVVLSPEYEDCARVAREQGVPLRDVFEAVRKAN
jgi:uncharacterized protein (TIGR00299 family) protein